jgi:threonylcarbamoyladenosine tRNA methylthiotransferase CDKAL1
VAKTKFVLLWVAEEFMNTEPWRHKIFVESFGCPSNLADGEFMRGCLLSAGFQLVDSANDADVLIYNTCAVKTPTENRAIEVLKRGSCTTNKRLIVTGCLPSINFNRLKNEVDFDGVLGVGCGASIVKAVQKVIDNEPVVWLDPSGAKPCLNLPRQAVNPVISIVPVAQGCLGSCSYCCVVLARGHLRSCSSDDIVRRIILDLDSVAREVWLTGQDMACYGRDTGTNLVELLGEVCKLEGEFWVRVGMMTPNFVLDILPELVKAFQDERIFKFLHLPVQSGDNEVLKRMNRIYTVEDFKRIVEAFRITIPNITVSTDVICGFPGESVGAFERTLKLIEDVKPDIVNISKFFPRPKTQAERMGPEVKASEVNERSRRMTSLAKEISFEKNKAWMNWKGRVLIDERGKQPNTFIGRNFAYKPIVMNSENQALIGKFFDVQVTKTFQTYLGAEIIDFP